MIAGHFGFAAGIKSRTPATPLWALFVACVWLDVIFVPLFLAGIERIEPVAGTKDGSYGNSIIFADYTHSFLGALVLSAIFGALFAIRYGRKSGLVLGLVSMSHWILDLPMHRHDMPWLPGDAGDLPRLGFGLWRYPELSAALELTLVVLGAALYFRAARSVAGTDPGKRRRATLCAAGILVAGAITLGLNFAGM